MKINKIFSGRSFRFNMTKEDAMGSLLAAIIGLPMGLAFGVQSGLGPQAGIYAAIILPIIASLFGGTRTLISDPTGPMTVVAATVVSMGFASHGGSLETAWPLIVATFILAGVFETLFGILNFGKYVRFMPYPVLSGFMAGIGVIIISVQLFPLLGQSSPKGFVNIITHFDDALTHVNVSAIALGLLTISIVYLFPYITKKVPSILVALIVGTVTSVLIGVDVPVIGEIPRVLPHSHLSDLGKLQWSDLDLIITPAIMLGGLGVIDSLLTSVVADNLTKTKHNSKMTVIGQGVGNMITAIFGGIPGAGATMGTVTNIKAGASTKWSGVMKGVFLLVIVVGIADYVQYIPMSVLAGILITIGIGIIDYKGVKMLFSVPRADTITWVIVLAVTLLDNLLDAVAVGFVLSAILFIGRMSKSLMENNNSRKLDQMEGEFQIPDKFKGSVVVKTLEGPLFFGFTDQFREQCKNITDTKVVILRMERVPFLDQSGMVTLEEVVKDWREKDIIVLFTGVNDEVHESLVKVHILPELIHEEECFSSLSSCLEELENTVEHQQINLG